MDDSEGYWRRCNEGSANKSAAQTLQRCSRICWKWSTCNKQNTWECWTCIGYNQQRSVTDSARVEAHLGISKTTVSEILMQDLGMKCVMAKSVPRLLLPEQKGYQVAVANDLIETTTHEPDVLKKVTTWDELWVYSYDRNEGWVIPIEVPWFSMPKETQQNHTKIKTTLTVFFDWEGAVHHKYATPGQIINNEYYTSMFFVSWDMQYDKNGHSYGHLVIGSFITTSTCSWSTCGVFWWIIVSPRWLGPPTAQTWHPVTSGFLQN